jgi:hypothetical protein
MAKRWKKAAGMWRRRFLSALARTANARLAAEMAGVDHSTAYALRERDEGFARAWPRARAWGRARVKAEGRPVFANGRPRAAGPAEALDPRELVVRTSKNGGTQLIRAGEGRMSPRSDAVFFAHLAAGFGIRRSAAAAGFSRTALYNRRMNDPEFAAQWDLAKAQGIARNDMLLIDCVPRTLDPEVSEAADDLPRPTIAEAIQIARMYRPRGEVPGRPPWGQGLPQRSAEEAVESILSKIEAIERHEAPKKLAEGWTQDEAGRWIPPGWVKAGGDGGQAGEA